MGAMVVVVATSTLVVLGLDRSRPLVARQRPSKAEPDDQYERPFLAVEVYIANMMDTSSPPPPEPVESQDGSPEPAVPPPRDHSWSAEPPAFDYPLM